MGFVVTSLPTGVSGSGNAGRLSVRMSRYDTLIAAAAVVLLLHVADGAAAGAASLAVQFRVATAFERPVIEGTTNLPDHAILGIALTCQNPPIPNCGVSGYAHVRNGQFVADFSAPAWGIKPGRYQLRLWTPKASVEPASVQAVIGQHGENLAGKYAKPGLRKGETVVEYVSQVTIAKASGPAS